MASTSPEPQQKSKITFTGTQSTLLLTLYGRHLESLTPNPLLNDKHAGPILDKIDCDFTKLGVGAIFAGCCGIRGFLFDSWTVDFLDRHPDGATVVYMACGLDTRHLRLLWNKNTRWIDVDLPEVVELRRKLVPGPEGGRDYTLLSGSALDAEFISTLPNDRPTLVIIEGLAAYLTTTQGEAMLANLAGRLKQHGGELMMDVLGWLPIAIQSWAFGFLKKTESSIRWPIDDPKALERLHEGLTLLDARPLCLEEGVRRLPVSGRVLMWLLSLLESSRKSIHYVRFRF